MVHLEITTRVGCKNKCVYCPQDKFTKAYLKRSKILQMSFNTFKKCIAKVPKEITIHFSGFTEPFLNHECVKMVMYASRKEHETQVYTTLVGINDKHIEDIKKIPYQAFVVHLPSKKNRTRIIVDEKYMNILHKLIKSNINNIFYVCPGFRSIDGVHPRIRNLLKKNNVLLNKSKLISRAGNVSMEILSLQKRINGHLLRCGRLKGNVLLPNGEVVLCCMDWSLKHILGNLLVSDYNSYLQPHYLRD